MDDLGFRFGLLKALHWGSYGRSFGGSGFGWACGLGIQIQPVSLV